MNFLLLLSVFLAFCGVTIVYGYPDSYSGGVASPKPGNCAATVTAFPPDPSTECCGVVDSVPKLLSGPQALIDQHPWLAQIEYVQNGTFKTLCNGALISGKYVLTGAHCVTGSISKIAKPENIILGEYDTSNEGKDCVTVEAGEDCTDGAVRIPIEKIIFHPEYSLSDKSHKNDIALIRMTKMAPYTDFIRPICLPTEDITLKTGAIYFNKASFGMIDNNQIKYSSTLLRVTVPFVTQDQCEPHYTHRNVNLWKGQLCAGGNETKDFCRGDAGAPLEYENGRFNAAIGLVSFGPKICGGNIPIVYTNIYEYNSWIKSNIVE